MKSLEGSEGRELIFVQFVLSPDRRIRVPVNGKRREHQY